MVEDNRRQKSEEKQIRENEDKLRGLESCEALVRSVVTFVRCTIFFGEVMTS